MPFAQEALQSIRSINQNSDDAHVDGVLPAAK